MCKLKPLSGIATMKKTLYTINNGIADRNLESYQAQQNMAIADATTKLA